MVRAILTDIEGTTTSISFVHQTLFPYSIKAMPAYVKAHWNELRELVDEIQGIEPLPESSVESVVSLLLKWIKEDKKFTPLKTLQGRIWAAGYESGEILGHFYDDAHRWLQEWHRQGISLSIFSSGSVKAQQLLCKFSLYGDLTSLFDHHFDTTTGAKRECSSYRTIQQTIGIPANNILFLSDITAELDAAEECGMLTCQLVRAEDNTIASSHHRIASDFEQVNGLYF